jgi:hypothetical protein
MITLKRSQTRWNACIKPRGQYPVGDCSCRKSVTSFPFQSQSGYLRVRPRMNWEAYFPLLRDSLWLQASAVDLCKNSCSTWLLLLLISVFYLRSKGNNTNTSARLWQKFEFKIQFELYSMTKSHRLKHSVRTDSLHTRHKMKQYLFVYYIMDVTKLDFRSMLWPINPFLGNDRKITAVVK